MIIKDGTSTKKYLIFLEDEETKEEYLKLIELLWLNGISVGEYTREQITYLGKNLSYKQIQAFKEKMKSDTPN